MFLKQNTITILLQYPFHLVDFLLCPFSIAISFLILVLSSVVSFLKQIMVLYYFFFKIKNNF